MASMSTGYDVEIRLRVGIMAEGDSVRPASHDTVQHPYHCERCDSDRSTYRQSFKRKKQCSSCCCSKVSSHKGILIASLSSVESARPKTFAKQPADLRPRFKGTDTRIQTSSMPTFIRTSFLLDNMLSNITRRFYSATASNMTAKKLQVGWVSLSPRIAAIAATADKQRRY